MKLRTIIALTILYTSLTTHAMQPEVNNHSYTPAGFLQGAFYVGGFLSIVQGLEYLQQAKDLSRALNMDPERDLADTDDEDDLVDSHAKQIVKNLEVEGMNKILLGSTAMALAVIYTYLQPTLNTEK
jgi:hypothetical protein